MKKEGFKSHNMHLSLELCEREKLYIPDKVGHFEILTLKFNKFNNLYFFQQKITKLFPKVKSIVDAK